MCCPNSATFTRHQKSQNRHQQATQADCPVPATGASLNVLLEIFGCLLVLQRSMTQQASLAGSPVQGASQSAAANMQNPVALNVWFLCSWGSVCPQLVPCCGQPQAPQCSASGEKPSKCLTTGVHHNKHGCCMRGTQCPVCSMTGWFELGVC
jgi:hypothetical protein